MRSILIVLLIAAYIIVMLPALLIFYLIGKKDPKKAERYPPACMSRLLLATKALAGTTLIVKGLENVPDDRPVLYISNHTSYFDIILTYPLCKLPTAYVAKADLKKIPFFGIWGKLMRCLFFDRSDAKSSIQMIVDGTNNLKTDTSVYIYPEGKRNKSVSGLPLNEFHDGSFKMALRSGAPVIPVSIKTASSVWEAHMPWVRKSTVEITYGSPTYLKDLSREDQKRPGAFMQKQIEKMLLS